MIFSSYEFIFLFLPITFIIYFGLIRRRLVQVAKVWLVFSSLFFYSWWNLNYLPLIIASMLFNFALGVDLSREVSARWCRAVERKHVLVFGITANLALLGFFKYADFFLGNFNAVFDAELGLVEVVLPLAISFFTFQQIAYLVDCYRREVKESDFLSYALFVSFFPQLIAGPIVHHKEMMPQFASRWNAVKRYRNLILGLFIFSIGLFKKVGIADGFAIWVGPAFDEAQSLSFFEAWGASLAYSFQLYFDFSGYTDMAIGIALMFNIRLPVNFNSPYKALNIQDFWRRWHITLGRFLRDYLYIPLGGNRHGEFIACVNVFITFLLGGLWHGASWMFVIWGALHGGALVLHRLWQRMGGRMPIVLAWLMTFMFVNFSWVFFRAHDLDAALKVLRGMLGLTGAESFSAPLVRDVSWFSVTRIYAHWEQLIWIVLAFLLVLCLPASNKLNSAWRIKRRHGVLAGLLLALAISQLSSYSEFIYFNF